MVRVANFYAAECTRIILIVNCSKGGPKLSHEQLLRMKGKKSQHVTVNILTFIH